MPEYRVLIKRKTYTIKLLRKEAEDFLDVTIDNKHFQVRLEKDDLGTTSPFTIRIGEKTYQVDSNRVGRSSAYDVNVNGMPFRTQLLEPVKREIVEAPTPQMAVELKKRQPGASEGDVSAPMAGKIVSIRIKEGDLVKAGDALCILEAMKMENEISATGTGRIQKVHVTEGSMVNEGDLLVTIS